jgi:hypothetical protein
MMPMVSMTIPRHGRLMAELRIALAATDVDRLRTWALPFLPPNDAFDNPRRCICPTLGQYRKYATGSCRTAREAKSPRAVLP